MPNLMISQKEPAKTIFITSFFGLIARNILATNVLKILKERPDLKIVILALEAKKNLYQKGNRAFCEHCECMGNGYKVEFKKIKN